LTINNLPGEVLLEIFASYRQGIDPYDSQWRKKYAWFNLAHVCRKWRAVMFASSSRLDLNIIVGPEKPGHIKTILSGHLPILIDYLRLYRPGDMTDSALWRMRAALRHRDRVREISFRGWNVIFGNSSGQPIITFPHWRVLSFTFHLATNRTSQPHFSRDQINQFCVFDVLHCTALPSHPYLDFYCPQRLSPTSLWRLQ
jgi:hypothetical protein